MILHLFRKKKEFSFERSYAAPIETVWDAWTQPEMLREWWGPDKTTITDCEVDLREGGRIYIVMEAGEGMGKYAGTRWPMEGTFSLVDRPRRLAYDARSWTEGDQETMIDHVNEIRLAEDGDGTIVNLHVTINEIGSGAKLASVGMKWGYKQHLDKLDAYLAS